MSLVERFENSFYLYFYKYWYRNAVQIEEQKILERKFGYPIPDLDDIAKNTSLMLVSVHHSLHGVRPLVPAVVEVGGIHLANQHPPLTSELKDFISGSEHGVILFSFGTLIKSTTIPPNSLRALTKAFAQVPQRIIWKWDGEMPDKPDNVLLLKWIPQLSILQHPNVVAFVSHGGNLGLTEAAHAGVPTVVVPFFADQPSNAAAAEAAGLATVLPFADISEARVLEALATVLSPEMRASAARLQQAWLDRPQAPLDAAVYWAERTARLGGPDLGSHARRQPAHALALLDVLALGVALLFSLLLVLFFTARVLFRAARNCLAMKKVKKC